MTQANAVKAEHQAGKILTVREMVIKMGINRPTDIILKLRKQGLPIVSKRIDQPNGKHYICYSLEAQA